MKNVWNKVPGFNCCKKKIDGKDDVEEDKSANRISILDAVVVTFCALLNQLVYLIYITIYFYYGAFYPLILLLTISNSYRHTPCSAELFTTQELWCK
jgi:hypothetical protein